MTDETKQETDELTSLIESLGNIDLESDSRRAASRALRSIDEGVCVVCSEMFPSEKHLHKHLKNVHRADSKKICESYKKWKDIIDNEYGGEITQAPVYVVHNYRLYKGKVACLRKYHEMRGKVEPAS